MTNYKGRIRAIYSTRRNVWQVRVAYRFLPFLSFVLHETGLPDVAKAMVQREGRHYA